MSKPPEKCKEQIWATGAYHPTQCSRAAKRDGFCSIHHPEAVAARRDKITARWNTKIDARRAEWDAKAQRERDAAEVPALRAALNAAIARAEAAEALARDEKEMADGAIKQRNQWIAEMHAAQQMVAEIREVLKSPTLLEALAAIEHERWSGWERYREQCVAAVRRAGDSETHEERWRRQRETAYADLSEREKESDRVEARKGLEVIRSAIGGRAAEARAIDAIARADAAVVPEEERLLAELAGLSAVSTEDSAHRMEQILQRLLEIEQAGALAIDREHERRMQDLDSMMDSMMKRFG